MCDVRASGLQCERVFSEVEAGWVDRRKEGGWIRRGEGAGRMESSVRLELQSRLLCVLEK